MITFFNFRLPFLALGHPKEPLINELRQNVTCLKILLQSEHFKKSARRASLLPVSLTSLNHPCDCLLTVNFNFLSTDFSETQQN